MPRIKCPFCVKPLDPTAAKSCPSCGEALPLNFVHDCRDAPPLWMVTSGFSTHGKTTLLYSIILMLENIDRKLEGFHLRWLDQPTHEALQRMRVEALDGKAPSMTHRGRPRPLLLRVQNAPAAAGPGRTENHTLVAYDLAGELFASLDELDVSALREVQTIWLMVSPSDLAEDRSGNTLPGLYQSYESAMIRLGASMKGRNLIVVYTKGDKMNISDDLENYLYADPFENLTVENNIDDDAPLDFSLPAYVEELERVSVLLDGYTRRKVKGGAAFASMVRSSGVNLKFCLTSATGGDPDERNRLREQAQRYRVLDPLFWTLWLGQRRDERAFGLVLDASPTSGPVYQDGAATSLWDALGEEGDVTTYVLGQSRPVGLPGQRPSEGGSRSLLRLIGPALERSPGSGPFLVVTTGPILDLADFLQTPWRDKIVLVNLGDAQESWPHTVPFRPGDDPGPSSAPSWNSTADRLEPPDSTRGR